jgi:hypothetical protein
MITFTKHRNSNGSIDYTAELERPFTNAWGETAKVALMWYNNTSRDWVVSLASDAATRYQVGPSAYVYSRAEAVEIVEALVRGEDAV